MSHLLDIDSVLEKLILLEHFAKGSKAYCKDRMTGGRNDLGNGALDDYWGWVKGINSNYLLECAIKFRVLQDTVHGRKDIIDLDALDKNSCDEIDIGNVTAGNFNLTLRESNNKIIHAKRVIPEWKNGKNGGERFRYWNGVVELQGEKDSMQWSLQLRVEVWARAMQRYFELFDRSDAVHYIGQDWY